MSNPDSFINEVTEDLRRDRALDFLRRYGWIFVLGVLLLVGGAAWNEWRKASAQASAEAFGDAVLEALAEDDPDTRLAALGAIDAQGAQTGILQLLRAAERLETDRAAALSALRAASEDNDLPQAYRQIAALKLVIAGGTDLPIDERAALLSGLAQPGQPLRPMALEQQALLELERGDRETAIEILTDLLSQSGVTEGLRQRVRQTITALGGEVVSG